MAEVVGVLDPWLEERERCRSPKRSLLPNTPPPSRRRRWWWCCGCLVGRKKKVWASPRGEFPHPRDPWSPLLPLLCISRWRWLTERKILEARKGLLGFPRRRKSEGESKTRRPPKAMPLKKKPSSSDDAKICANCGQEGPSMSSCARCGLVFYCGKDCQSAH